MPETCIDTNDNKHKQEEELIEFKVKRHDKLKKLSSGFTQNELLTVTSEQPYAEDPFERKFQANVYPSDQNKLKTSKKNN